MSDQNENKSFGKSVGFSSSTTVTIGGSRLGKASSQSKTLSYNVGYNVSQSTSKKKDDRNRN